MTSIEIDFEVFKALTMKRASEKVSYNDVLRQLLGIEPLAQKHHENTEQGTGDWVVKGVRFPEGTDFRATYKGQDYTAKVSGGALHLNGLKYYSPSPAATAITNNPVNGWNFWESRMPGETRWRLIKGLRKNA